MDNGAFLKAAQDSPNSVHRGAVSTTAVSAEARTSTLARLVWQSDDVAKRLHVAVLENARCIVGCRVARCCICILCLELLQLMGRKQAVNTL
jgi:hypothetical protein